VLTARVGNGLLVHALAPREVLDFLYQDLEHLGSLVIRTNRDPVPRSRVLPPEQQKLLRLLLDGTTLSEAAAALSISRRTADRRVAAARRFFNVGTTAELLRAARHELP
jgi:DNA-binding NarL/FixJ family response regulator